MIKKYFLGFFLILLSFNLYAAEPLPAEQAFSFSAKLEQNTLLAQWAIAPGYYLYRERISLDEPDSSTPVKINLPAGIVKQDEILGKHQVFKDELKILEPLLDSQNKTLRVTYQGCAEFGFCYPPVTKIIKIQNGTVEITTQALGASLLDNLSEKHTQKTAMVSEQDKATQLLEEKNGLLIVLTFLGIGLILAFTPCVLPLIPILSGIIIGQREVLTTRKAFSLSLTYVLAMALTYATAGVLAGLAGSYVQAFLQNPWVIAGFSAVFVLLALALFDIYTLQLPPSLQDKLNTLNQRQQGGKYIGVFIMGVLSTLIVSPCITAPLIGVLTYISKTGNAILGGVALFSMGLGSGIPLLIIGTSGGKLLPKAGPWMNQIKSLFGFLLLAIAIWLISRVISSHLTMYLWAILFIFAAVYMGALTGLPKTWLGKLGKGISLVVLIYGFLLAIGAVLGNTNPLSPITIKTNHNEIKPVAFKSVKSLNDLQHQLLQAKNLGKPVMLDFYADWCVACKQMERNVFNDSKVQAALNRFIILRADVTANDIVDQTLLKHFNVIAPPSILFFDQNGKEKSANRIVGEVDQLTFLKYLNQV